MLTRSDWRAEEVVRLFLWVMVAFVVAGLAQRGFVSKETGGWAGLVAGQGVFDILVLASVHWFLRAHKMSWTIGFGIQSRPVGRVLGIGFLAGMAFLPAAYGLQWLVTSLLSGYGIELPPQRSVEILIKAGPAGRVFLYGAAAIGAPIVEEVLFRGVLFAALRNAGWPRTALVGSALLFGVIHLNLGDALPLVAFGLLLALLYEQTGSLLAPIAAHIAFNTAPFVMLVVGVEFGTK